MLPYVGRNKKNEEDNIVHLLFEKKIKINDYFCSLLLLIQGKWSYFLFVRYKINDKKKNVEIVHMNNGQHLLLIISTVYIEKNSTFLSIS